MEDLTNINPRLIETQEKRQLISLVDTVNDLSFRGTLDRNWAKNAFLLPDGETSINTSQLRYYSSANSKFTDTTLGGNFGINAKPQFNRYGDIRVKGTLRDRVEVGLGSVGGGYGMGRYYSEAIDDPSQTIYLAFGVPQFNSLGGFLSKAFSPKMTRLAKTGIDDGLLYEITEKGLTAARWVLFPVVSAASYAIKYLVDFMDLVPTKFYTLKKTPDLYWNTVETLVNALAINLGIFPLVMGDTENIKKGGSPYKVDEAYLETLDLLMPGMFKNEEKKFVMSSIACKAQMIYNEQVKKDHEDLNNDNYQDVINRYKDGSNAFSQVKPTTLQDRVQHLANQAKMNPGGTVTVKDGENSEQLPNDNYAQDPRLADEATKKSYAEETLAYLQASAQGANEYACFKVEYTGAVQESFGNTAGESDLSQKLNGISSNARQAKFSFANGNIGGETITNIVGSVKSLITKELDGLTFGLSSSFFGILGSGYMDIPKYWQNSSATLPRCNYTMTLMSPYGNPISQMQNIYIPLCMILAGTLPLSTGKSSYTSPFICSLYDQGKCQIKLGMIESLSISRGVSNLPFNLSGGALAIEVSFSVVDLSSIMHMPIGNTTHTKDMTLDEDNILVDYLAVLAGQDMYSQQSFVPKLNMKLTKLYTQWSDVLSPAKNSIRMGKTVRAILKYTHTGVLESLYRNSSDNGIAQVTQNNRNPGQ
jgi:hypothetical protein